MIPTSEVIRRRLFEDIGDPALIEAAVSRYMRLYQENWREMPSHATHSEYKAKLLKSYPMTYPAGVGLDKKTLFVCDDGIRIFDISNPLSMTAIKYLPKIDALDVIPQQGTLLVIGEHKLTQLDYRDINNIKTISEFDLK